MRVTKYAFGATVLKENRILFFFLVLPSFLPFRTSDDSRLKEHGHCASGIGWSQEILPRELRRTEDTERGRATRPEQAALMKFSRSEKLMNYRRAEAGKGLACM